MYGLAPLKNPVAWQEATHQLRAAQCWTRIAQGVGVLFVIWSLIGVPLTLQNVQSPTRDLAIMSIWIVQTATAVYAILAGANAISREHAGQTWDLLVLSELSARQILFGKWRAALYRARGWMLALGLVRLAMLPVFMLSLLNRYAWYTYGYGGNGSDAQPVITWMPSATLLAVGLTVALTVLEVMCCTAIGLAASAIMRRGTPALILGLIIRFVPVAIFAGFTRYQMQGYAIFRWWRNPLSSVADAGTSALYQLVLPVIPWTRGYNFDALFGLALAALLLLALLSLALLIALNAIRRGGALPDPG